MQANFYWFTNKSFSKLLICSVISLSACAQKPVAGEEGITIVSGNYRAKPPAEPNKPSLASQPGAVITTAALGTTSVQEAIKTLMGTVNVPGRENWASLPSSDTNKSAEPKKEEVKKTQTIASQPAQPSIKSVPRARVSVSTLAAPQTVNDTPAKEPLVKPRPFQGFDPSQHNSQPSSSPKLPGFDPTKG